MKQIKFYDKENDVVHGGLLDDDGSVICGCCGGRIEPDEIGDGYGCTHKILKVYDNWVDLDDYILN